LISKASSTPERCVRNESKGLVFKTNYKMSSMMTVPSTLNTNAQSSESVINVSNVSKEKRTQKLFAKKEVFLSLRSFPKVVSNGHHGQINILRTFIGKEKECLLINRRSKVSLDHQTLTRELTDMTLFNAKLAITTRCF
jgi:hypothetical protein